MGSAIFTMATTSPAGDIIMFCDQQPPWTDLPMVGKWYHLSQGIKPYVAPQPPVIAWTAFPNYKPQLPRWERLKRAWKA